MIQAPTRLRPSRADIAREIRADLRARRQPVNLATKPARPDAPPSGEVGDSGIPAWGGNISGADLDYVAAWQLPERWYTIQRMTTDPDIGAVMAALTLPILAAPLNVEPASDDPFTIELADFVDAQLNGMSTSLTGHRFEVLRYPFWGSRLFEIVMGGDATEGHTLRKLALRPNKSITYWHVDDHGGPDGVTQRTQSGTPRINMDRLLMFVHQREGGDITGRSMLRDVYRPWLIIDDLVRVGVVAVERHGAGLPVLHYTGTSATEKDLYERALMAIRAHTKGYLLLANGVEGMDSFKIQGVEGSIIDPVSQLNWHQQTLYRRMLAQFMLLGSGDVGSFALSADQSGFFLQALRFIADEIDDIYNRHLIPKLIGYNWTNVKPEMMPKVMHGALDKRDTGAWFTNVVAGINAGVRFDRRALDAAANDMLGIPYAPPDETVAADEEITPMTGIQITAALDIIGRMQAGVLTRGQAEAALKGFLGLPEGLVDKLTEQPLMARRELDPDADTITLAASAVARPERLESEIKLEALGIRVDFAKMTSDLDKGRDRIIKRIGDLQAKQARLLGTQGARIAKGGKASALAAALFDTRKLAPYDEEAKALAEELEALYGDGEDAALGEIEDQGAKVTKPDADRKGADRDTLRSLATVAASLLAGRMVAAWASEVGRQLRTGTSDAGAIADAAGGAGGKLLADLANQRANDAYGSGRGAAIEANGAAVGKLILTAVIDGSVCQPCYDTDGNEYTADEAPAIPLDWCLGQERCRCQLIPVIGG